MIAAKFALLFLFFFSQSLRSDVPIIQNTTTIKPDSIEYFYNNPEPVKKIILMALSLSDQKLGYLYGSSDPKNAGMDCSGTMFYLLTSFGLKDVPRSSEAFYSWVKKKGQFQAVSVDDTFSVSKLRLLKPGDLLFWSGTYANNAAVNSSHVMLYLGKDHSGNPIMFGSSNGRTYQGKKVYGVSIFDFLPTKSQSKGHFIGYSCIPGIGC